MPGFRVEPRALQTSAKVPGFGSTWNNMGGYTDHSTVPGRACSSVRVANASSTMRAKGSSHSHIPHLGATDLRNPVDAADQDHPLDRPASSHKKNPEVKDAMVSILLLEEDKTLLVFLSSHIVCSFCLSVIRTMEGSTEGSTTLGH